MFQRIDQVIQRVVNPPNFLLRWHTALPPPIPNPPFQISIRPRFIPAKSGFIAAKPRLGAARSRLGAARPGFAVTKPGSNPARSGFIATRFRFIASNLVFAAAKPGYIPTKPGFRATKSRYIPTKPSQNSAEPAANEGVRLKTGKKATGRAGFPDSRTCGKPATRLHPPSCPFGLPAATDTTRVLGRTSLHF